MKTIKKVGRLQFIFDASWRVDKYDDWVFYRNEFIKMQNGIKAIDLIAIDDSKIWLIEVKDYRLAGKQPTITKLVEVVVQKAFNTLAAMLPAQVHASDPHERQFAQQVNKATQLRVVLHIELPQIDSTLFHSAIVRADVQQKLRQKIKPIDSNPQVVESGKMGSLAWQVR